MRVVVVIVAVIVALAGCGRLGFDAHRATADSTLPDTALDAHDVPIDAAPRANKAFISVGTSTGNFGGLAGADAICRSEATAAGLPGTFVALMADSTHPFDSRITGRGWVDISGAPIVDLASDWLSGKMVHPLRVTAKGSILDYVVMWGGTANTCSDWTTATTLSGTALTTSDVFSNDLVSPCGNMQRIACVEVGNVFPVAFATISGRRLFVTPTFWLPSGGLAAADAFCMTAATTAGLPGTYVALLTTSTTDAFARVSFAGAPWMRIDGIPITQTTSELAGATWFDAYPNETAAGTYETASYPWTGTGAANCNNWVGSGQGVAGDASAAYNTFFRNIITVACSEMRPLICLEP